jgi:hypothetical protein
MKNHEDTKMNQVGTMSLNEEEIQDSNKQTSFQVPGFNEPQDKPSAEPLSHHDRDPLEAEVGEEELDKPAEAVHVPESSENVNSSEQYEDHDSHQKNDKSNQQLFNTFLEEIEKLHDHEAKLQKSIEFMENSLSQTGSPHFKCFWEVRNVCLQLFKENIPPANRALLWHKYSELSKEARRLKEILDEQSAFAVEQIDIAIKALEEDILHTKENLEKGSIADFPHSSKILQDKHSFYHSMQKELNLLNAQAARINALRKELIRTEMRVRQKNKFFQSLSAAGDKVFPRRKELIKEISQQFVNDIDTFIAKNFNGTDIQDSLFYLREEIKALQGAAKILTLNTHSFTHTRLRLSECWDKIKGLEKERKKERAQQKQVFKQNVDQVLQKIQELSQKYSENNLSTDEATKQIEEISHFMRGVELGRDEIKFLRDELNNARKPILEKTKKEEQDKILQEQERERTKKQLHQGLKQEIENLLKTNNDFDANRLGEERDLMLEKIHSSHLTKIEKQELERQLKPLRDIISDKKENALMDLSEDDRQALKQLKEILVQRKERRQEVKNQIENLRKNSGTSGFDFEQAMTFNAALNAEKERLEKSNQGIKEIEQKIADLQKKVQ